MTPPALSFPERLISILTGYMRRPAHCIIVPALQARHTSRSTVQQSPGPGKCLLNGRPLWAGQNVLPNACRAHGKNMHIVVLYLHLAY